MTPVDRLTGGPPAWATRRGRAYLALNRRRRVVAAGLVAVAALIVAAGLRAPPPPTVGVLAAAHDLAGGAELGAGDVVTVRLPPAAVPDGALRDHAAGRRTAGPLRRGEPLTDARLLGPGLLAGYPPGTVAAPVRVADADVGALLQSGDHVDILAAAPGSDGVTDDPAALGTGAASPGAAPGAGHPVRAAGARVGGGARAERDEPVPDAAGVIARDAPVVAVVGGGGSVGRDGVLVVVAVSGVVAGVLAREGVGARVSVTIRSR
jgi:hypothetical protein